MPRQRQRKSCAIYLLLPQTAVQLVGDTFHRVLDAWGQLPWEALRAAQWETTLELWAPGAGFSCRCVVRVGKFDVTMEELVDSPELSSPL